MLSFQVRCSATESGRGQGWQAVQARLLFGWPAAETGAVWAAEDRVRLGFGHLTTGFNHFSTPEGPTRPTQAD